MRINVYSEEISDRVEIISKEIDGHEYTAVRFYMELPVTVPPGYQLIKLGATRAETQNQLKGPFIHRPGDDDSAAVTFWGKQDLRKLLRKALDLLDKHYEEKESHGGGSQAVPGQPVR